MVLVAGRAAALLGGLALVWANLSAQAPEARAHRLGKPVPEVQLLPQPTPQVTWFVSVRLVDDDSRDPIRTARVHLTPSMAEPHRMVLAPVVLEESPYVPGLYSGLVAFPHPARWTLTVEVSGDVIPVRREYTLEVPDPAASGVGGRVDVQPVDPAPVPVRTSVTPRLGPRAWIDLSVLVTHLLVGAAWIAGLTLAALGWGPGRTGIAAGADAVRQQPRIVPIVVGSWLALAVMVTTGIYNAAHNMPVRVDWFAGGAEARLAAFDRVPFGKTYGLILLAKHAVIVGLTGGLVGLTIAAGRRPAGPALRLWLGITAGLGGLALVQSVALGYYHRLIAHF
jgi:hypothetical protein